MKKCPNPPKLEDRDYTEEEFVKEYLKLKKEFIDCQTPHNQLIDAIKKREAQS